MGSARSGCTAPVRKLSTFRSFAKWRTPVSTVLGPFILLCNVTIAQDAVYQRTFPITVREASATVQKISASSKGRLPTLEGFVQQPDQPIELYDKGYFECTFQVLPIAGAGTLVRATAKVTAWYSDPDTVQSGYRVLVSNGRLESDALDRIAEIL